MGALLGRDNQKKRATLRKQAEAAEMRAEELLTVL